jgi:uncharacterized protein (TIGR02996 family)
VGDAGQRCGLDELFARVYAAPDAVDVRLVLADALLEAGDPRGELIALQHARRTSTRPDAPTKRERELLKRHAREWLGRIAPSILLTQPLVFELGFAAKATFRNNAKGRERIGAPEWSTLEWLDVGHESGSAAPLLFSEPIRRWLRTAWRVTGEDFAAAATSDEPIAWREVCVAPPLGSIATDAVARGFRECKNLRDVRRIILGFREWSVSYHRPAFETIVASPLTAQLDALVLTRSGTGAWPDEVIETLRDQLPQANLRGQVILSSRWGRLLLRSVPTFELEVELVAGGGPFLSQLVGRFAGGPYRKLRIRGQTQSVGEVRLLREAGEGAGMRVDAAT